MLIFKEFFDKSPHKVFFYYNYIIGGKNSKIDQIPRLIGTYIHNLHNNYNTLQHKT
jgi:hypothetical protein